MKMMSEFARQAAKKSARISGLDIERFPKKDTGAPIPVNGVFWSISHKKDKVAGIAARHPVGIDIEKIKPVNRGLFDRVVSRQEAALFGPTEKEIIFFKVFTAKEAVLKLNGCGIGKLSKVRISGVEDAHNLAARFLDQKYWVENFYDDGYLASVTKNGHDIRWTLG